MRLPEAGVPTADPSAQAVRHGFADTVFGQLRYAELGSGPALLLLHQTPRSHDEFRELQPLLAVDHRTIAMDMLGFGDSAKPPGPQSIELYAAGAFALLDAHTGAPLTPTGTRKSPIAVTAHMHREGARRSLVGRPP